MTGSVMTRGAGEEAGLVRLALARTGRARLVVHGCSMLPSIPPGGTVVVSARPFGGVRAGEVVAFGCGERIIVHRVTGRSGGCLVTRGDNMPLLDPPVSPDAYLGVVPGIPDASGPGTREPDLAQAPAPGPAPGSVPGAVEIVLPPSARAGEEPAWATLTQAHRDSPPAGSLPAGWLCVGVSPAGVLDAADLAALLRRQAALRGRVRVLLGFTFGIPGDGPCVLPPEAAAVHARLGGPWEHLSVDAALTRLGALIRGERCP